MFRSLPRLLAVGALGVILVLPGQQREHRWLLGPSTALAQQAPTASPDARRQAAIAQAEGSAALVGRDYPVALAKFQEALALYRQAGDQAGEASALIDIGRVYERTERIAQALEIFQQSLNVARMAGARYEEASALRRTGAVLYNTGQYRSAVEAQGQAVALARADQERARAAREESAANAARTLELGALNDFAVTLTDLGRYGEALAALERALVLNAEQKPADMLGFEGLIYLLGRQSLVLNRGIIHAALGQYDQAGPAFREALEIAQATGDDRVELVAKHNLAAVDRAEGRLDDAVAGFNNVLADARHLGARSNERAALFNLGALYLARQRYDEAQAVTQQSLDIARALSDNLGQGTCLNTLGVIAGERGDHQLALDLLTQALAIFQAIGARAEEATTLGNIAEAHERQGRSEAALERYFAALDIIEDVRTGARVDELRAALTSEYVGVYRNTAALLLRQGRIAEALAVSERARARTFLDQLAAGRPDLGRRGDLGLLHEARTLQDEISELDARLRKEQAAPSESRRGSVITELSGDLQVRQAAYSRVLTRLKATDPEAAALVAVTPPDLAEVQAALDDDTSLLSYYVMANRSYAFVITRAAVEVVELPAGERQLRELINEFRRFANVRTNPNPPSLGILAEHLIAPVSAKLTTRRVGIAPHGPLHYLPFAALEDGATRFGERHELFTVPSVSSWPLMQAKRKGDDRAGRALVLAQGDVTGKAVLRFVDVEAQTVAELYGVSPVTGAAATESAVRERAGQNRVVHVAAHGELNAGQPLFSRLFLGPDGQNDGSLTVGDIYSLPLTETDLVVLSACETSLGVNSAGEDVVGLVRALHYAGASSVVASLWEVNDRATAVLMGAFHRELSAGSSKAAALQAAQAETRAQYPHPFFWAAFVLNGDPGA